MSDELNEVEPVPDSGMDRINEEPVGWMLKQARIGHGWDIDDIDRITHISPGWVLVIENGDWGQYPSMVYAKGHVRAYADALELDVNPILERFQKEWDLSVVPESQEVTLRSHPGIRITEGGISQRSVVLVLVVIGLLVMIAVVIRYAVSSRSKNSKEMTMVNPPPSNPPVNNAVSQPASPPTNNPSPSGEMEKGSSSLQPTSSPSSSEVLGERSLTQEPKTIPPNGMVPPSSLSLKPSLTLKMVALKSTWVVISVDDGTVRRFHMKSGESQTLSGKNFMTFSTGSGNGLVLFLNGKRIGLAGLTSDPVMHRRISRASLRMQKKVQKKLLPNKVLPDLNVYPNAAGSLNPGKSSGLKQPSTLGNMPLVPTKPEIPSQNNSDSVNPGSDNQAGGTP